jgi:rod shape-determining protein MreC
MQAFVGRHTAFFVLLAVMLAQLLLLSVQITRGHKVRLIQVWAIAVFDPFARAIHWTATSTSQTWRRVTELRQAEQENQTLRQQLNAARTENQQLAEQASEAGSLRSLLELKKGLTFETLAAEVIARSPGESAHALFIDKGSNDGLKVGMPVLTPDGVVGKIIAVFPRSSQVLLITDPSSGVGCMLEKSRVQGVLKGASRELPQLNYILNEYPVTVGERILTSGLDQIYPKGLPVGVVLKATEGPNYKTVVVQPAAQLDQLESVLVALNPLLDQPADAKQTSQR